MFLRLILLWLSLALALGHAIAEEGMVIGDSFGVGVAWAAKLPSLAKTNAAIHSDAALKQLKQVPRGTTVFMSLGTFDAVAGELDVHNRVESIVAAANAQGVKLVWIGPPCVLKPWETYSKKLDEILEAELAGTSVIYVSMQDAAFCDPSIHTAEGVFLSMTGYTRMWQKASAVAGFPVLVISGQAQPPSVAPEQGRALGYHEAELAFSSLSLDSRIKLQILLTTAGYWLAVPNESFSKRLFGAISRFQSDNGFTPSGALSRKELDSLVAIAAPLLNEWRFQIVKHPAVDVKIWVPLGMNMVAEEISEGAKYSYYGGQIVLSYKRYDAIDLASAFGTTIDALTDTGGKITYSKIYKDDFFVVSGQSNQVDIYTRFHTLGGGLIGFVLRWPHNSPNLHGDRIATLISGSLWSAMTGARFTEPFDLTPQNGAASGEAVAPSVPLPTPTPPLATEDKGSQRSSGTGFFVTHAGAVLTNSHVIEGCSSIRATTAEGISASSKVVARDATNDLALLTTGLTPSRVAGLRTAIRLGEGVEAFGYPLTNVLASAGNFTLGNVSALAGMGDDSRYLQISAPVQPGNSGGPLLDQSANIVGVVSAKLNALNIMVATKGDIPQNVNFAIKASVVANFLQTNGTTYLPGESNQQIQPADIADRAKAMSVFIECN
jgi:serine protease Do